MIPATVLLDVARVAGQVAVASVACVAVLVWNQPAALLRTAARIERGARWTVTRLRVRAWSKQDANEAYRRAYAFHSRTEAEKGMVSGG